MDFLIAQTQNAFKSDLPDELSIDQMAVLSAPNDLKKQEDIRKALIELCKSGSIEFYGSITGWKYIDANTNLYPRATGTDALTIQEIVRGVIPSASGRHCLIHKDNFKIYLQSVNQWPLNDSPLANWWSDDDPIKPRTGGYFERDKFAIALVKQRPELLTMRPGAIEKVLKDESSLFLSGYPDWRRNNPIFPKGSGGRNPK